MIQADRLVLRGWREKDIAPVSIINFNPAVMERPGSGLAEDSGFAPLPRK